MEKSEITSQLKEIMLSADESLSDKMDTLTDATTLRGDLGFSSVNMLYMVIAIEESFGIRFDNVTVSDFDTLGDTVDFIARTLK